MIERLTVKEAEALVAMSKTKHGLSLLVDRPNTRVMNSLVKKGFANNIMDTFWKITEAGLERLQEIKPEKLQRKGA
jgi:hypothetical protein